MSPRWLAPAARYLHSWIVSKRCLGVVAGFQHLLGVREERTGRSGAEGHHYRCVWPVHAYFKVASVLGSELFYIVFLPIVIWQVDWQLGRSAIIFWNILFYIGNLLKDLLCLPRPLNPPVLCLEQEYSAEYGLPSVHALGTFVPLYCLLKAIPSAASTTTTAAAAVSLLAEWRAHPYWRAWLLFSTSVCASRLYLGVHSLPDLVAGLLLGGLLLAFGVGLGDATERFAIQNPWGGAVLCLASLLMVLVYPKPDKPTPTLGYTVSVMGAGGGVLLASRHLLAAAPTSKPAATALATLTNPPPFSGQVVLRVAVGLAVLIGVKELTKPLILAALRPFLPRLPLRDDPSLVDKGKGIGKGPPPRSEWEMAPAQVLAKYLIYFAVGAAVVYPIPLLWSTLGL